MLYFKKIKRFKNPCPFSSKIPLCLLVLLVLASILAITGETSAQIYYLATNGNDSYPGTESQPWATFSKAMTVLQPGDTLNLKDGTYYQQLRVNISGTNGNPITIKALNKGKAIVDGKNAVRGGLVYNTCSNRVHDIDIEGIVFKNGVEDGDLEVYCADRINVKKVSAYSSGTDRGGIVVYQSNYVLVEDCAVKGGARILYDINESDYCTIRRCWGRYENSGNSQSGHVFVSYGGNYNVFENNVAVFQTGSIGTMKGFYVWANYYNDSADYNKFYGNVAYNMNSAGYYVSSARHNIHDNYFKDNVSISTYGGFIQRGDSNLTVLNHTSVNETNTGWATDEYSPEEFPNKDCDHRIKGTLKNSTFSKTAASSKGIDFNGTVLHLATGCGTYYPTLTHTYNNFHNFSAYYSGTIQGTREVHIAPNFNTTTYGKGAYLIRPSNLAGLGEGGSDIGAEVLYRYVDGKLTSSPLWPWPMEGRIKAETGFSVTWETNGGLWKTLNDVYGSVPPPPSVDTIPPAPPAVIEVK